MKTILAIFALTGFFLSAQELILQSETAYRVVRLPGKVEAMRDTQLLTNRMAEVVALPVKQGAQVKAGTVLIRLEDKALQQQIKAVREAEAAQSAVLEQAKQQAERMARLLEKGAVARVALEAAALQAKGAEAKLQEVRAQIRQLQEAGAYLEIRAKSDGQLAALNIALGDTAMPGQALGRFVGRDSRALAVSLPDYLSTQLDQASWRVRDANGSWQETGVEQQVNLPDATTNSRLLYLSLPKGLAPNQRVDVEMLLAEQGLFIPKAAIERRGNLTYVHVMEAGKPQRRLVKVGAELPDGRFALLAGLEAGATLLIGGDNHE